MKYLIEIHHGIGDIIQITGLIQTISQMDNNSEIGVIVNSKINAQLLEGDTRIKSVYFLNLKTMSKISILHEVMKMRMERYDYMFLSPISNQRDAQLLAILVGAKNIYGEQLRLISKGSKKYHCVERKDVHIVQRNNNLLMATGMVQSVSDPLLEIKKIPEEKKLEELEHPVIAICIGTSKEVKTWPVERYLYVAKELEKLGYNILFLGGMNEVKATEGVNWSKHPRWHNYIGKTTLMGSAALLRHCSVVLGGDTGALHMAAAVGCKTVTLFTCSDPKYHAPYSEQSYIITTNLECQYCYAQGTYNVCKNYQCRDLINQEEVLQVVECIAAKNEAEQYKFLTK